MTPTSGTVRTDPSLVLKVWVGVPLPAFGPRLISTELDIQEKYSR